MFRMRRLADDLGDVTHMGSLYWLTSGTAEIPERRNSLAMLLSFPGIIFYGIALFSISDFIRENRQKKSIIL